MQFQVPQFIDIAPKLVGPLTLKQFLYIAAAVFPSFLLFFVLEFLLWALVTCLLVGIASAFAFVKVNGQSLEKIAAAAFQYFWKPRMYLWKRADEKQALPQLHSPKPQGPLNFKQVTDALKKPFFIKPATPHAPSEEEKTPLGDLSLKLNTTVHPIEKREKSSRLFNLWGKEKESLESFRKTTGERDEARRVDYR